MIFFSVVVATYGRRGSLRTALSSVASQTMDDFEIIVVDDGSDPAVELPIDDPKVRLIRRSSNGGAGAARNSGVAAAMGEWVTFLDDDDEFYPRRLEALRAAIEQHPDWDLVATDFDIYEGGRFVERFSQFRPFVEKKQFTAMLEGSFLSAMTTVRRTIMTTEGGFDEALLNLEDWECWLRLMFAGHVAGFVDEPLARYNRGQGKSTNVERFHRMRAQILDRVGAWNLAPDDRKVVMARSEANSDSLLLIHSRRFIKEGAPHPRPSSLKLLRARTLGRRNRIKFFLMLAAPSMARTWLRWRAAGVTRAST